MKTAFGIVVTILLLGGWTVAALSLHVVRTPDRILLLTKARFGTIQDTYCDTRAWTVEDLKSHVAVVQRILETGKAESIRHVVAMDEGRELEQTLRDAIKAASDPPRH